MVAGTFALVVGLVLLAVWDLYTIRTELEAGRGSLDDLTLELASSEGLEAVAADAAEHLERAASIAHGSVALRVLSALPVVDDQIAGIRRMTEVTDRLGASAVTAAERLDRELDRAGEPAGRVALLDVALAEIDRIEAELAGVDLGSPRGLVGPLRGAHTDLVGSVERARAKLAEGRELAAPVHDMLVGPSRFLLLAANNAEMAGGAGLALSAGTLSFEGGDIDLGDVAPARELRLERGVSLPGDLAEIYSPTGVGIDFRSATRSPNLPAMGPVVSDMVQAAGGAPLDGVLVVDAIALKALMEVTGGVEVSGRDIDADNVLAEVLNENYKEFATTRERAERDSYQGDIAKAVFDAVTERDVPAAELAATLLDASEGRHLMMWAARPELQDVWEELGVSGKLHQGGLMVSFQNYAANKMDWYLRPQASLDVGLTPDGDYRARLTMEMAVPAKADLLDASPYILGPTPDTHGVFLTAHLPAAAYDITTTHERGFRTSGTDGPMQVRTFLADVPLGGTLERVIEFTLPREHWSMLLLPSARLEPLPVTIDGTTTVTDDTPTLVTWDAAVPLTDGSGGVRLPVRVLVVLGILLTLVAASAAAGAGLVHEGLPSRPRWIAVARASAVAALVSFVVAGGLAVVLSVPRV